jgi:hypothetical protein
VDGNADHPHSSALTASVLGRRAGKVVETIGLELKNSAMEDVERRAETE